VMVRFDPRIQRERTLRKVVYEGGKVKDEIGSFEHSV